jgi:type III secretion protein C
MPYVKCIQLMLKFNLCLYTAIITYLLGFPQAKSAELYWNETPYSHYAQDEDIKIVLTDFFAAQGIGVVFSEDVSGTVSGNFKRVSPQNFFTQIADAYNLIWYYDGAAVYVYSAHEMTSMVVNLGYLNMSKFRQNLRELDIIDPKFALRMVDDERILYVSGPTRYVELVAQLAKELDAKAMSQRGRDDIVRVFPLKYAWAEDKTVVFRDREMTIIGVATLLQDLITGTTAPGEIAGKKENYLRTQLTKLKGSGLSRRRPPSKQRSHSDQISYPDQTSMETESVDIADVDTEVGSSYTSHTPPNYVDTDAGFVRADARQNAIVVRDREEKMSYYQEIIDLLDVPVGLVEIRATIMDIDRKNLEDLGIEWEFAAQGDDGDQVVKGGLNTTTPYVPEDGLLLPTGGGLNLATIVGSATDFFLSKVYALQEKGHAKILSRPSVLTLNNIEAQLEHSQTFYVRVEGTDEVDLFDVNAGVVLRVTPHIIEEENHTLVKLSIQIEDGEIVEDEEVDDIPIVKNSIINTQAVVGKDESLLIGGYLRERNYTARQSVPCLGDIPLVGWLFTRQSKRGDETERLFLITPTIKAYGQGGRTAVRGKRLDKVPEDHATKSLFESEKDSDENEDTPD